MLKRSQANGAMKYRGECDRKSFEFFSRQKSKYLIPHFLLAQLPYLQLPIKLIEQVNR